MPVTVAPFTLQTAALKPGEIAQRLDVEPSTVYRWMRTGELPSIEIAGAKYVLIPAYERFLERRGGVTIEHQVERDIGRGFEEEHEDAFDPLEGLALPIAVAAPAAAASTVEVAAVIEDARDRLKRQLDEFEARYGVASEHVHRLYFVERQMRVEGVPDDLVPQWAGAYAAYLNLSLLAAL